MTTAHLCIALALATPYLFTAAAKIGGGFRLNQNRSPREFLAQLDGFPQRANFAQLNSFEVAPAFAAAVLVAHQAAVMPQARIDLLAITFVVSRVLYGLCYIANWASMRSLMFFVGAGSIITLFVQSA